MEKYSEVLGLPVICASTGKKLGIVKDIIFCPKHRSITAFIIERKGYEFKKVIFTKDILNLGKDAMVVDDDGCIREFRKVKDSPELKDKGEVLGLQIYTKTGNDLGVVKDVLFDYKNGTIEGLEVSDGLIHDVIEGRTILPLFGKVEFGEENVLVDNESVEEMTKTGGGIKNLAK